MTQKVRCVIVDDERLARQAIRDLLSADRELELVGEARDGDEALDLLQKTRADLLFLDIQMPEMSGFELIQALETQGTAVPATIFVTAYDQYALQAFDAQALDYLLKPIDEPRFQRAVASAKTRVASQKGWYSAEQLMNMLSGSQLVRKPPTRIPVKAKGRVIFVRLEDVEWIEAEANYLRLHLAGESYLLRETMNSFEARVDGSQFMRIHRSTMVNIDRIRDVQPWFTGEYIVRMKSGKELTLTRTYRDNLRKLLGRAADEPAVE